MGFPGRLTCLNDQRKLVALEYDFCVQAKHMLFPYVKPAFFMGLLFIILLLKRDCLAALLDVLLPPFQYNKWRKQ